MKPNKTHSQVTPLKNRKKKTKEKVMTVEHLQDQQNASSSDEDSVDNSLSAEEEETDSETEPVVDSKKGETSKTRANSSSPVTKPPPADSNKVETSKKRSSETGEGEEAKRVKRVSLSGDGDNKKSTSSSEGETDSESETESVADSKIVETSSKPKTTANSLSEVATVSSSYEDSSSSSGDEETDPPVPNPVVEPPAESSRKVVEASSKKQPSIETDEGEAKRDTKKNYFQRVWTEEDEIVILQGIIDYRFETGSNPFDDKNALYELLKESVSFNPTKIQFLEKIRGLKKKFDSNLGKEKKKGEELAFSKSHDLEAFRLSKFVWGDHDGITANAIGVEPAVLKLDEPKQGSVSLVESVTRFGMDDLVAKKGWSRLSSEDKKSLEEEWEALALEEFKFYSRKSRIIHDAIAKMAEASQPDH
ncbi:probable transcription factor At1g11510 [Brassica rapa]|uniref:Uncharacterized protein n=1 Tax=Brassica campestris TaxID=3711 RepID=M4FBW7_BRACM|nr:probable transcription factor At1g11510 [Brassica rapa]XP_033142555.1 probable transcription factor At1g11510 [Brassica rapa]XP_033142556.1 probable transcription factor At1g11510 [Brassica rapa]XP_033142557.1 probable transcription factor At1g11510 [Brassica rapa]XP_033142558.1 probable transcription factor At1g11510 [Brassica rapa]XP_033142559.1 probable transcription factor At1g11510 [Brassica rapa]XP_033142560.1 probable transcription factor At1g11510 [Brassica rapa]